MAGVAKAVWLPEEVRKSLELGRFSDAVSDMLARCRASFEPWRQGPRAIDPDRNPKVILSYAPSPPDEVTKALSYFFEQLPDDWSRKTFLRVLKERFPDPDRGQFTDPQMIPIAAALVPWAIEKVSELFPDPTTREGIEARGHVSATARLLAGRVKVLGYGLNPTTESIGLVNTAKEYLVSARVMLSGVGPGDPHIDEERELVNKRIEMCLEESRGQSKLFFDGLQTMLTDLGIPMPASSWNYHALQVLRESVETQIATQRRAPTGPGSVSR